MVNNSTNINKISNHPNLKSYQDTRIPVNDRAHKDLEMNPSYKSTNRMHDLNSISDLTGDY
jgi:hypothetical protein